MGSLSSFVGFGLPAFFLMLVLAALYEKFYILQQLTAVFAGLEVTVVAIIVNAATSFSKGRIIPIRLHSYYFVAFAVISSTY
jgi:chromate transporter